MATVNSKVSTILFDIGNVIVHFDYMRAVKRFSEMEDISQEIIEQHFYCSEWERMHETGQLSSRDFYQNLKDSLELKLGFGDFVAIWNDIFWLNPDVAKLVERLKGKYQLASLSNTNPLHYAYCRESFPILDQIDVIFTSHELGVRKPDPGIYVKVTRELGVEAGEIVFVDDLAENVRGATAAGMRATQYVDHKQLKRELSQMGVQF